MPGISAVGLIILSLISGCSQRLRDLTLSNVNSINPNIALPFDYDNYVLGTWVGIDVNDAAKAAMYITFKPNNIVVIDYSPNGGRRQEKPYHFLGTNKLEILGYPENFIIDQSGKETIHLRPEGHQLREDIEVIYVYEFRKVKAE